MTCESQSEMTPEARHHLISVSSKTVIGVGEIAHGSGGLHTAAAHLIIFMIEHCGVRRIFFEAPNSAVLRINQALQASEPVLPSDLDDLYFVWRSRQNLDFFNKLSKLNRTLSNKVQLIGIDIRQPVEEYATVTNFLSEKSLINQISLFPVKHPNLAEFRSFEKSILVDGNCISLETMSVVREQLDHVQILVDADVNLSVVCRLQITNALQKIRTWLETYFVAGTCGDTGDDSVLRDLGMFETFMKEFETLPANAPVVIWAHLAHLVYDNQKLSSDLKLLGAGPYLGKKLRDRFEEKYVSIGIFGRKISISAPNGDTELFTADSRSLESNMPDSPQKISIASLENLLKLFPIKVGLTDHADHPLKESYLEFELKLPVQFDFAAMVDESEPILPCK